jgi:hypothetical protein
MPLPVGNWDISADGSTGTLSVSASGSGFSGTLFGDPITGFFDETSQCFRFMLSGPGSPPHVQIYAGTLFTTVTTSEVAGATYQTTTYTLGGSFDDFWPLAPSLRMPILGLRRCRLRRSKQRKPKRKR